MTISSLIALTALAWTNARADYVWSFPRDHWAHHGYKTEWWYFTGELTPDGASTPRFAYQLTLFNVGASASPQPDSAWSTQTLVMGHAAITDLTTGEHRFSEVVQRTTPFLAGFGDYPDRRIAWCRAPAGTAGRWELDADGAGFSFAMADTVRRFAFALQTQPAKPQIFEGANGYSRKSNAEGDASLYYSQTRLTTRGTVELDGERYTVQGESWMDKEFSTSMLGPAQVGWDWFSLQLADGRELMLYVLRRADGGSDFASGTLVGANGSPRYLGRDDFTVTSDRTWTSPTTHAVYPARWRVTVPSEHVDLSVEPLAKDQENVSSLVPRLFYWEGAVRVSGCVQGHGFVELTGYGTTAMPALRK